MITRSNEKSKLKASMYNFEVDVDGDLVLYNTRTGSLVRTEADTVALVKDTLRNPNENFAFRNELLDQGFLVEEDTNELSILADVHERYIEDDSTIDLTIMPSESCNLRCPYCFIYKQRNMEMEDKTFSGVLNYIEQKVKPFGYKKLNISWYGGEPTLAYSKVIDFMSSLSEIRDTYNLDVRSAITTNGVLLTKDMFLGLLESGITDFQVTIDGHKATHDSLRMTKDGKPTFDIIFNNLDEISTVGLEHNFSLKVRANFLLDGENSMYELLEMFNRRFGSDSRFGIYFRPVYNFETERSEIEGIKSNICNVEEGHRIQMDLEEAVQVASSGTSKMLSLVPKPIYAWCNVVKSNQHIIGADGTVFACDTLMVDKNDGVGELNSDGELKLNKNATNWKKNFLEGDDELTVLCKQCKLLPICMGGCYRSKILNKTNACVMKYDDVEKLIVRCMEA